MNSIVKSLYQLVRQCLTCEQRLEPYKLSEKQIAEVFVWLDQRRRSFIDVSDFYTKFPDLSETQLFYVFKFLDVSRKGAFTHEDLQSTICMKQSRNVDTQDDSIRGFTNIVRILKATFHLIQQHKKKLGLNSKNILQIFNKATLKKKDKLDLKDLIILFKEEKLEVDDKIIIYLQSQVFKRNSLTIDEFVQIFAQLNWQHSSPVERQYDTRPNITLDQQKSVPVSYLSNKTSQKIKNTDKINSQIDKILKKYKDPEADGLTLTNNYKKIEQRIKQNQGLKIGSKQIPRKETSDVQSQLLNFKTISTVDKNAKIYQELDEQRIDDLFNFTTPISSSFGQINRRRQQLRRGSLERQRIIDDVVNRKMRGQFNQATIIKPGALYNTNLRIQTRQEPQLKLYQPIRVSSPTYQNSKQIYQKSSIQSKYFGKSYDNNFMEKDTQILRPASATKTAGSFFDKTLYTKLTGFQHNLKPDLNQFYRRAETPKNFTYEKENILKRAQEQATKKIQQIQRRARLKVMQKRSTTGVYNRWLK